MSNNVNAETDKMLLYSESFLNYMKKAENDELLTYGTEMIHESPEGGNYTIGYGHKLTDEEVKNNKVYGYDLDTLTRQQANDILLRDLEEKNKLLTNKLGVEYTNLDPKRKQMLLDIEFNVGDAPGVFPNFTEGVLQNKIDVMKKEYKRKFTDKEGKTQPLTKRNELFSNFFFSKN